MSAFTESEQRRRAINREEATFQQGLSAGTNEQQRSLMANTNNALRGRLLQYDAALTGDQKKARTTESNLRAVAPRYQGTGLAQMFGAQGTQSAKTRLGQ